MELKISPSILSADFSKLGEEIKKVEPYADMIHIDVMDGHFAPNISIGIPIVEAVKKITNLPLDVHLMISEPEKYIEPFAKAGSDIITVHAEVAGPEVLDKIHELGKKAGISINPDTPLEKLDPYLDKADMVVIMCVNPGFGGQCGMDMCEKIKALREKKPDLDIQVDGGIKPDNAKTVIEAGANVLVSGSGIFHAKDPVEAIKKIKNSV